RRGGRRPRSHGGRAHSARCLSVGTCPSATGRPPTPRSGGTAAAGFKTENEVDIITICFPSPHLRAGDLTMIPRAMLRRFRSVGLGTALLLAWACMPAPVRGQGLTALASFNGTNG